MIFTASCGSHQIKEDTGFKELFNGKNLDGWVGNKDSYKAIDGMIVVDPNGGGSGGNLFTVDQYSDFILKFEFQLTPGGEQRVGIHAPLKAMQPILARNCRFWTIPLKNMPNYNHINITVQYTV